MRDMSCGIDGMRNPYIRMQTSKLRDVFLKTCGFSEQKNDAGEDVLHLAKEKMSLAELQQAGIEIDNALKNPFFGVL